MGLLGPTALLVCSTRLGTRLAFTRSCLSTGSSTTEPCPRAPLLTPTGPRPRTRLTHTGPRLRARLTPTEPRLRPGPSTTDPCLRAWLSYTGPRLRARLTHTEPRPRLPLTSPGPRPGSSLTRPRLEAQPSTSRPVPHRPRRRGEAVVQGVRGRCGARVVGGVVQLPPPVVLVTATGGRSPLLAHAPNCPPHRPYENGASRKSSPATPVELCCEGSPDGSTPHGRTARRRRMTRTPNPGSALSVTRLPVAEL